MSKELKTFGESILDEITKMATDEDFPQIKIEDLSKSAAVDKANIQAFHVRGYDEEQGSIGVIKGSTKEELEDLLKTAFAETYDIDRASVVLPKEINWDFWKKHNSIDVIVTFYEDGECKEEEVNIQHTWIY